RLEAVGPDDDQPRGVPWFQRIAPSPRRVHHSTGTQGRGPYADLERDGRAHGYRELRDPPLRGRSGVPREVAIRNGRQDDHLPGLVPCPRVAVRSRGACPESRLE